MSRPKLNAQTPGPLALAQAHEGFSGHAVTLVRPDGATIHREQVGNYTPEAIRGRVATVRLLASSYTMADAAGRKLGVDAAKLCEGLDLAALILAAQAAGAALLESPPDPSGLEHVKARRALLDALPANLREPRKVAKVGRK